MPQTILVRYGAVPEIARFEAAEQEPFERGRRLIVRTHRGAEIGVALERVRIAETTPQPAAEQNNGHAEAQFKVLRAATPDDEARCDELRRECERQFDEWRGRIAGWKLELELIDLEWTLDREKLLLYVLNERGPECTKLALYAAAAGLGPIEVQPVGPEGLMPLEMAGGGCGSGSGGCGPGG